jgi:hypothetical protein
MESQQNSGQPAGQNQPYGEQNAMPAGTQVYNQPVAGATPQLVYVTRPHQPIQPELTEQQKQLHEESKKRYPDLNLSKGEFIISAVDRHPIGLLQIWLVAGIVLALIFVAMYLLVGAGANQEGAQSPVLTPQVLMIPAVLLTALDLLFAFVATSIYNANKFFLTNESVIQVIQDGLFSRREQTVSLANIEDASYNQHGIVPHIFDYGMIRLSTEGDETTYRFNYASRPKRQVALLNNAVEAFKNGRPVTGEDD